MKRTCIESSVQNYTFKNPIFPLTVKFNIFLKNNVVCVLLIMNLNVIRLYFCFHFKLLISKSLEIKYIKALQWQNIYSLHDTLPLRLFHLKY